MSQVIETRTELISLDDDEIVRCKVKQTREHRLVDAIENVRATAALVGLRPPLGRAVRVILGGRAVVDVLPGEVEHVGGSNPTHRWESSHVSVGVIE